MDMLMGSCRGLNINGYFGIDRCVQIANLRNLGDTGHSTHRLLDGYTFPKDKLR